MYWLEFDPATGANQLWAAAPEGPRRVTAADYNIRSQVNGYGGGALCATADSLLAVEAESQQIEWIDPGSGSRRRLTHLPDSCFGGLVWDHHGNRALAVRESAGQQQLVAVALDGGMTILHQGQDFYSAPAISHSGRRIAWVSWSLPDMPWVSSTLRTAAVGDDGRLCEARHWPTPAPACVQQPVFQGEDLWVLSDHQGWWQPWRHCPESSSGPWLGPYGEPWDHANAPWQLGESHHVPLGPPAQEGWARVRYRQGTGELWLYRSDDHDPVPVATDFSDFRSLQARDGRLYCIARSATRLDTVLEIDVANAGVTRIAGGESVLPEAQVSTPRLFRIPPSFGVSLEVSGFLYPPVDAYVENSPDRAPPPLIVIAHGGPTSAAYPVFDPQIQFWCHHGFAVAEVNYRGSSGFGREFRMALAGHWGEVDAEDVERTVVHLANQGLVDGQRAFVQGRSSGGYTALMAMIRGGHFRAGASLFGVSNPTRLRQMTHRFESGYLDWLLGPPDAFPERWHERTPVYQAHRIKCPMIFFQGGQDRVVVPEQTEAIVSAIEEQGIKPEVHWFPEEGHGFRQRASLVVMLERLLDFYQRASSP